MKKASKSISGFSKLSKMGKLKWIVENFFKDPELVMQELKSYWLKDPDQQRILDQFSENTISNFHLPYGVAPNFILNGTTYCVPMVIEESSVVAAASYAAKFWSTRGGFRAEVLSTRKVGQVYFSWTGSADLLTHTLEDLKKALLKDAKDLLRNMDARGGGVRSIEIRPIEGGDHTLYCLYVKFDTKDSMGANFINSVLECFASTLQHYANQRWAEDGQLEVIMAILSNYTPECLVRAWVSCQVRDLGAVLDMSADEFARRFKIAIDIARLDPHRAATHNKGIFNGIDALVIATGNDFRAVEANGHAYAARNGRYAGLSHCQVQDGNFEFSVELPIALGTVGGLTSLHPMAKRSLELLGNPDAEQLMMLTAAMGLAQNFAAVRSLVTTGIQHGHMRMHLVNILSQLEANDDEAQEISRHFEGKVVSYSAVRDFLVGIRSPKGSCVENSLLKSS